MVKYGEIEPTLYTGTVAVSIPIYHYKDNDFDIPISLNYASNGCIPNVRPGMLGPNWTLGGGGFIAREIRGMPDNKDVGVFDGYHSVYDRKFEMDSVKAVWYNKTLSACMYVVSESTKLYDAEPDIYHFNVPGYSGSFHLDYDHGVKILASNTNRAELQIEVVEPLFCPGDYYQELKITTGDGYVFHFFGANGHDGNNLEGGYITSSPTIPFSDGQCEVLKWNLSCIEAPNGRVVIYHYNKTSPLKNLRPYTYESAITNAVSDVIISSSSQPVNAYEYKRESILDWIEIDGRKVVSFEYMNGVSEKPNPTIMGQLDSNNVRLSAIKIWADDKVVKESRMSYTNTGSSQSGVLFLEGVFVEGEGTYAMAYDHLENYPPLGITSVDHWGYYNGKVGGDYLDVTDFNYQTKDESFKANNCRIPDANYARIGLLTRLTYPTGGYTDFSYEPHTYSAAMVRSSTTMFEPLLTNMLYTDLECGGLRVWKVSHHDSNGTELTSKEYVYASLMDNGLGSGILVYMPRYKVAYHMYYDEMGNSNHLEDGVIKSNNLTRFSDTHIEYSSVLEVNADGSVVQYNFTTSRDYPDEDNSPATFDYSNYYKDYSVNNQLEMNLVNRAIMKTTSMQALRGKLLSKTAYDSDGGIIQNESFEYLTDSVYCQGAYNKQYEYLIATMNIPAEFVGRIDLFRNTTTSFFAEGNRMVSTSRTYNYNSRRQIAGITEMDSKGKTFLKTFVYVTDALKDSVELAMLSANVISWPTSELIYYDGVLTSEKVYYFCRPDPSKLRLFRVGKVREKDVTTNTWYDTEYSYDKNGNLLEIKKPDNRRTCYLWGYGGMYPVAAIDGCSLAQIESISVFSGIEDGPFTGGLSATAETALRNGVPVGAEVWTYEFEPLVGPVRVTGPDDRKEVYDYNNAGKLMRVYDNSMHLRESYYYSPENR